MYKIILQNQIIKLNLIKYVKNLNFYHFKRILTMEYTLEYIIDSIINGQRKQAIKQLSESGYLLDDLFEELLSQDMEKEIILMYRIALNTGYISFNVNRN